MNDLLSRAIRLTLASRDRYMGKIPHNPSCEVMLGGDKCDCGAFDFNESLTILERVYHKAHKEWEPESRELDGELEALMDLTEDG